MVLNFDLKKERLRMEMTQIELANKVGVSLAGYRLWETGGGNPSPKNMKILIMVLGLSKQK